MPKLTYIFCTVALLISGCSTQVDSSESNDLSTVGIGTAKADIDSITVVSEEVVWTYIDRIGRGDPEVETTVTGFVEVNFYGPDLPVADNSSRLQPAVVRMSVPSFGDPEVLVERVFYVLFETFDLGLNYGVYPNFNTAGGGSIVDADLPDALARFNSTYSFLTQEGRPTMALPGGQNIMLNLVNNEDRAGSFSLGREFSMAQLSTFDSAQHTIRVSL